MIVLRREVNHDLFTCTPYTVLPFGTRTRAAWKQQAQKENACLLNWIHLNYGSV